MLSLRWLRYGLVMGLMPAGCGSSGCGPSPESRSLPDGQSTEVSVRVVNQGFGDVDVNGGYYRIPYESQEPPVRLDAGTYDGSVTNNGGRLVLRFEGRTAALDGPIRCE